MNSTTDLTKENLLRSSLWGVARGLSVHTFIYPLEVVKIRQQCAKSEKSAAQIALALFRQEGIGAFYKGLSSQLLKTSIKQIWCWPMITGVPSFLQRYQLGDLQKQAITGFSIATIDAVISTPLERAKILSASTGKSLFSLKNAYKDGWRGGAIYWAKLSVNWVAFLMAQKHLRDRSHAESQEPLSLPELAKIGTQVALIVSLASAPFDNANTLKQAQNRKLSDLFSRREIVKFYRGWPLNALALIIHNIASVIVIDRIALCTGQKK